MKTVTLSSKYQVVIPKHIREETNLQAGTKFQVLAYDDRIELIPVSDISDVKGIAKGMDTTFERIEDRL